MKKRSTPTLDARKWALGRTMGHGGSPCRLCVAAPDVGKDIETIVAMKCKGETDVSYTQLRVFLREKHGLQVVESSLLRHVRDHLGLKWGK